jgi:hypothetical protein
VSVRRAPRCVCVRVPPLARWCPRLAVLCCGVWGCVWAGAPSAGCGRVCVVPCVRADGGALVACTFCTNHCAKPKKWFLGVMRSCTAAAAAAGWQRAVCGGWCGWQWAAWSVCVCGGCCRPRSACPQPVCAPARQPCAARALAACAATPASLVCVSGASCLLCLLGAAASSGCAACVLARVSCCVRVSECLWHAPVCVHALVGLPGASLAVPALTHTHGAAATLLASFVVVVGQPSPRPAAPARSTGAVLRVCSRAAAAFTCLARDTKERLTCCVCGAGRARVRLAYTPHAWAPRPCECGRCARSCAVQHAAGTELRGCCFLC